MTMPAAAVRRAPGHWLARVAVTGIALVLLAISCVLPILRWKFTDGRPDEGWSGFSALLLGWAGIFYGVPAWYANPLAALGGVFLLCGLWRTAAVLEAIALALGVTTFLLFGKVVAADEGGVVHMTMVSLGPGAWVWAGSMAVELAGAIWLRGATRATRAAAISK